MPNSGQPPSAAAAAFPALARPPSVSYAHAAPAERGFGFGALLTLFALGLSVATANPGPTIAAVLSFALIVRMLWRPGLPPVLLFVCLMQWLQGALMTLHADALGVEIRTQTYARHIEEATYYTLGWVTIIAFGAFLATRRLTPASVATSMSAHFSFARLLVVYGSWTAVLQVVGFVASRDAYQTVLALQTLRWAVVFAVFVRGSAMPYGKLIVLGILCIEIAIGFLSFFSSFKIPLYVLAIALMSAGYRPTPRQYVTLAVVFVVTLYLGIVWSSIKGEYRDRLNGGLGTTSQEVSLSTEEAIEAFVGVVGTIDAERLETGAENLVKRIAYVEYFAYVIGYVPGVRAHEDGRIWLHAFTHVLMPRILFPDKAPLESDSVITERYTGIDMGNNPGTSITIGVPAETYVDLGPVFMFAVPLFIGLIYGGGYRYFLSKREAGALAQGVAVALHIMLTSVGSASTKVLGGYLSMLIIALLLWRFGWPLMARFLSARQGR
jgi:hypothetical protein